MESKLNLSNMLIILVVVGMSLIAISVMIGSLQSEYGGSANDTFYEKFNDSFTIINKMNDTTKNMQEQMFTNNNQNSIGIFGITLAGGLGVIKLFQDTVPLFFTLIGETAEVFGIPAWFVSGVIAIVIIVIVFVLLSAFSSRGGEV